MSKTNKTLRRAMCLPVASMLIIGLSACSGAGNNYGALKTDAYASIQANGKTYSVSEQELWDELKWSSYDVLDDQITKVITNKYINNITLVMNKEFSELTDADKEALEIETEAQFQALNKEYTRCLKEIVVKDIYNYEYNTDCDYLSKVKDLVKTQKKYRELAYVDEIYNDYHITQINGTDISTLVDNGEYLTIANDETLRSLYYSEYAKKLFCIGEIKEDVKEAWEDDEDEDDDKWGYYTTANFVNKFKTTYTNLNDIDLVLIRFTSDKEYTNTLRAFGLKFYNGKLYFINDDESITTYEDYITYYDEFSSSKLGINEYNSYTVESSPALELFVQIYNYMYEGYRSNLSTGNTDTNGNPFNVNNYNLNNLRELTAEILKSYTSQAKTKYNDAVNYLKANYSDLDNATKTRYTAEELNNIDSSFKTYLYETLDHETASKRYSTATQAHNDGYYIAYKFDEEEIADTVEDYEKLRAFDEFYSPSLSDYEILEYIKSTDGLLDDLEARLINDDTSEIKIGSYMDIEREDVKVKIYNEALEITYLSKNSNYSKTISSPSDKNILAQITYDDKTWDLNIVENAEDQNTICWPGSDRPFGVYNFLESSSGYSSAINIISTKLIKDSKAYEKTNEDRSKYETAIKYILLSFANNSYSQNGYPSTLGKYNFLMLYFHTASIDEIIDNTYRIQSATSKLMTDYSSDTLINFFKTYSDSIYNKYFSLTSTRMVVYFDGDEDGVADDAIDWKDRIVTNTQYADFNGKTFEYVAKSLVYEVYNKLAASTQTHTDYLATLVEEINNTAKVVYEDNPIASENVWSKYRHLGLKVKTEEIEVTNSSTDIDFNIKERLYNYSQNAGTIENYDASGNVISTTDVNYQYFINDTYPSCYIEPLTPAAISEDNNYIVESKDGYNLLLVTEAKAKASAEWKAEDYKETYLTNITFKYNDNYVTIPNIYNDTEILNENQIKAYLIDNAVNAGSTITPEALKLSYSTFLEPVYSRYTADATQRIILLSFIRNQIGNTTTPLYDVITFANTAYNGANGILSKMIVINQKIADSYSFIYTDPNSEFYDKSETVDQFSNWWDEITAIISDLIVKNSEGGNA